MNEPELNKLIAQARTEESKRIESFFLSFLNGQMKEELQVFKLGSVGDKNEASIRIKLLKELIKVFK